MGDFALIDSYLDALRTTVSWRPDSEEVIAELADHLHVSVEFEIATGADPLDAQRQSLDRFGEPRLVSRAFASTHAGGVAVPTEKTRRYGLFGMIGAVSMLAFFVLLLVQITPGLQKNGLATDDLVPIGVWMAVSVVAFGGIPLLILGIKDRHGGTMGRWAWVAFGLALAAAVVQIAPWMVPAGALFAGLGALIAGAHMLGEGRSPRIPTLLFSAGLLISLAAWLGVELIGAGTVDYWGDAVLPRVVAFAVVIPTFVPGYFLIGRWLYSETPVEGSETPLVAS